MNSRQSLPYLLAALLVLAVTLPAVAAPPRSDVDAVSPWATLADWLAHSRDAVAAVWSSSTTGGGDFGLGIDPDGTDPDGDGTTNDPPPDDGTTNDPPPDDGTTNDGTTTGGTNP